MEPVSQDTPRCPIHGIPDCSPLLNGCSWRSQDTPNPNNAATSESVIARLGYAWIRTHHFLMDRERDKAAFLVALAARDAERFAAGRQRGLSEAESLVQPPHPMDDGGMHPAWEAAMDWTAEGIARLREKTP